jgi:hypothetical protein
MRSLRSLRVETVLPGIVACGVLSGCAFGNSFAYHDVPLAVSASGSRTVAVGTHDQRPGVLNGDRKPDYVGTTRGGYGNPFDVSTASDQPLSDDVTATIVKALAHNGFNARAVRLAHTMSPDDAVASLVATGADRLVLLTVTSWRTDTYVATTLHLGASIDVLDKRGRRLGSTAVSAHDDLGRSSWDPVGHAKAEAPKAVKLKLEELLNHPKVSHALAR